MILLKIIEDETHIINYGSQTCHFLSKTMKTKIIYGNKKQWQMSGRFELITYVLTSNICILCACVCMCEFRKGQRKKEREREIEWERESERNKLAYKSEKYNCR